MSTTTHTPHVEPEGLLGALFFRAACSGCDWQGDAHAIADCAVDAAAMHADAANEAERALADASIETLVETVIVCTHRLHNLLVADRDETARLRADLRATRDEVRAEIVRRATR